MQRQRSAQEAQSFSHDARGGMERKLLHAPNEESTNLRGSFRREMDGFGRTTSFFLGRRPTNSA